MEPSEAVNVPYSIGQRQRIISSLTKSLNRLPKTGQDHEEHKDTIGLNLLFVPPEPLVDLIFVHGLWGDYQKTWSATKAPSHFWPKEWLSRDPGFKHVRISSYGFRTKWNEDFKHNKKESVASLLGKELFTQLKESKHISGTDTSPIIMVGHSIGGLMIKEAALQENSKEYQGAKRIRALFFFATPHQDASESKLHQNIILACTKSRNSPRDMGQMQKTNENFAELQSEILLWSFYESLETELDETTALVLEKASAIIDEDKSQILESNHADICKFKGPEDPAYWSVRDVLVTVINKILQDRKTQNKNPVKRLRTFLAIVEDTAERDLIDLEENRVEGSCEWVLGLSQFDGWLEGLEPHKKIFCLEGIPGAGKSVIATVVIRHLETSNRYCSYYFFRQSDQDKSTVSAFLRSIAFQMARGNTKIRESLLELQDEDSELNKDDSRTIWQKVYVRHILRTELLQPHYWVIDALNECSDYEMLINFLAKIDPDFPLRILLTSRPESDIRDLFRPMVEKKYVHWETISTARSKEDIKHFFQANESQLPRGDLIDDLVKKSSGNFLWATLILKLLPKADTEEDIQRIIDEVPAGMDELYDQILQKISRENDPQTAKAILTWTVCSIRPLSVGELKEALERDIGRSILNLERTITRRCGHLVSVDCGTKVQVVHATARAFLLNNTKLPVLAIQESAGHSQLALTCLNYLVSSEMEPPAFPTRPSSSSRADNKSSFREYACTAFSSHLVRSDDRDVDQLSKLLFKFLETNVLSWIEFVSRNGDLSHLINAAEHFKIHSERCCEVHDANINGPGHQELYSWATDLLHLVAKLGKNLISHPDAIFFLIPPICPPQSAIFRNFGNFSQGLSVRGLSSCGWDEQLTSIKFAAITAAVACSPTRIAVGLENGDLILYHNATYQESWKTSHGGEITLLKFTEKGNLLASSGRNEINIWDTQTGQNLCMIPPPDEVISMCFQGDKILQGLTRKNHYLSWNVDTEVNIDQIELQEPDPNEQSISFERPIARAKFSAELNILAIAYRSDPIWLWDLEQHTWLPGACRKHSGSVSAVNDMIFSPDSTANLLATGYSDGDLVLYNFKSQAQKAIVHDVGPQILAVSPDGRTLASGRSSLIQIFELKTLKLIYLIRLADCKFDGLVFSSESDRLIGIRDDQCSIWNPSVLVESSLSPADNVAIPLSAPEKIVTAESPEEYQVITSIACYPDSHYMFCGRASGAVDLYDTTAAKVVKRICKHDVEIKILTTCSSVLACVDTSTHASVRSIRRLSTGALSVKEKPLWVKRMGLPVRQILLSPSGERLLAITDKTMFFVTIAHGSEPQPIDIKYPGAYWSQVPSNPKQLVAHEYHAIHVWDWHTQRERASPEITLSNDFRPQGDDAGRSNRPVLLKLAHELLRLDKVPTSQRTHRYQISSTDNSSESSYAGSSTGERAFDVLGANVELVIGLHRSELLFLDTEAWICSVNRDDFYQRQCKRHFFLPFDWLRIGSELVINVTTEGDVVVGKGAEVAVFHNGLGYKVMRQL